MEMSVREDIPAFPTFTDLGALADELATRGNVKLRAVMTQAWRAQSCLGDLRQAADCVAVLKTSSERPTSDDTPFLMATDRALMTTAILLYARATSTNGGKGERGSVQLAEKKLTPDQWADHQAILDVRNQAMAHVYSSRMLGGHHWHRDIFFAVDQGDGHWKPASASNQTSFHAPTFQKLERMLPIAHSALKENFHDRMEAVSKLINGEVRTNLLEKHAFNPVSVFGGHDGVKLLLASAADGEASYWVNEGQRPKQAD